jgi:hypothetical protein
VKKQDQEHDPAQAALRNPPVDSTLRSHLRPKQQPNPLSNKAWRLPFRNHRETRNTTKQLAIDLHMCKATAQAWQHARLSHNQSSLAWALHVCVLTAMLLHILDNINALPTQHSQHLECRKNQIITFCWPPMFSNLLLGQQPHRQNWFSKHVCVCAVRWQAA